jgi:hypothetical protein
MRLRLVVLGLCCAVPALADVQRIAPGNGLQNAVVIDTGTNGICETTAARGDLQAAGVGAGSANRTGVRCGPNRDAETTAQGDDVQLIAVGGACRNANAAVVDTGANGSPRPSRWATTRSRPASRSACRRRTLRACSPAPTV